MRICIDLDEVIYQLRKENVKEYFDKKLSEYYELKYIKIIEVL
jgi:hypothetical protein